MKVTIENKSEKIKFPCLMESKLTGAVVLFVGEHEGVQVTKKENPESPADLGHYSEDWNTSYNSDFWKPFNGKIILEND